jgi:TerC family integral membrane protein
MPVWLWIAFTSSLLFLLAIDLTFFARKPHAVSIREAAWWSAIWIGLSLAFNLWLWRFAGSKAAMEFFSGYLIEKSLSVDNLFVFIFLFRAFSIDPEHQHRVLSWGVIGALFLRGAMIVAGITFVDSFSWALDVLGVFLIYAALHMLLRREENERPDQNRLFLWLRRRLPTADGDTGTSFFVRQDGRWLATSLFLAVLAIESADLLFAMDSIPAVFGVTRDPFIVFSSNACAILGLRALYFMLAGWVTRLRHLNAGISIILLFLGLKMIGARWIEVPIAATLEIIAGILVLTTIASLVDKRPNAKE